MKLISDLRDYQKKVMTKLKHVKNELSWIYSVQKLQHANGEVMSNDYKFKLMTLFKEKQKLINDILLLKSGFSIIDQMFRQEIMNVENQRQNFCFSIISSWCCHRPPKYVDYNEFYKLKNKSNIYLDPEKINHFIMKLMDPFRDEETEEQRLHNLETLWFDTSQQEWISKKNSSPETMV